jgi:3-phosphoshikimate 1-carboxyvinyltransferase
MVAACFAKGESVFEGVGELRIKETDRIRSMSENLKKMGADIRVLSATSRGARLPDGQGSAKFATKNGESAKHFGGNFGGKTARLEKIIIQGGRTIIGATVKSFGDHRTAMSMVVAGLAAEGKTRIDNISCINKSFPNFLSLLKTIIQ